MCKGGFGGPFRMAWKITSLRKPCERKRLATMHSCTMSNLPASCRLAKAESVLPKRENNMNSRRKRASPKEMLRTFRLLSTSKTSARKNLYPDSVKLSVDDFPCEKSVDGLLRTF